MQFGGNADLFLLILFTKLIVNDVLVTAIALSIFETVYLVRK